MRLSNEVLLRIATILDNAGQVFLGGFVVSPLLSELKLGSVSATNGIRTDVIDQLLVPEFDSYKYNSTTMITYEFTYFLAGLTVAIFALAIAIMLNAESRFRANKKNKNSSI